MPRFHLGFPSPSIADLKMPDNAALARLAEALGFDTLWHSNQRFYREMFVRMASSAMVTERIGIGGAIAEPFAVHPLLTAQSLASVQELSGGRATLALGAGGSGFQMMGIQRERSARALREAYAIAKGVLAGEEVTLAGELIAAHQARLQFQLEQPPTLWVATRGDVTLKTAGEYADAIMIATYATPTSIGEAVGLVRAGAERAGRDPAQLRLISRVDTCVHSDYRQAYEGVRIMIARFLWSSYPDRNFVRREGLEVPPDIEALIAKRDYSLVPQAAAMIPDEFVRAFCWAGTPDMVAERVASIARETGVQEFGFWMLLAPGQTREEAMRLISEAVVPRVQAALAVAAEERGT
jgi:5,10-methylenetetrahydromethanopterin reductase